MGNVHRVDGPPSLMQRATVAVCLSLFFVLVYGVTNWLTALRPADQVGTWHFSWEQAIIPYVPALIVPYMSLDVFFFFAPFLCRSTRELQTFARRVVGVIGTAAIFFLVMPLRLDWPTRPQVDGWFGDFVEQSCTAPFLMEYPHNLFPSLHIALCLIVLDAYTRRTDGIVRLLLQTWFLLIGVATLLTWQHHVIDIAGGLMLGGFAFYAFRETTLPSRVTPHLRIGYYYAAGAVALALVALTLGVWGSLLLWPTAALGLTASAYFGLGPTIFRKSAGRLPLATRFVLAPILLGHYLSLIYYRRQCRTWDEVAPRVLIGRALNEVEALYAIEQGVTAVLDLTSEFSEATSFLELTYHNVPILDLTAPTQEQLHEAVAFIATHAKHGTVYIHCKIGYSRSAAVAAAYLLATEQAATIEDAIEWLRAARPSIIIRPEIVDALRAFICADTDECDGSHMRHSRDESPRPVHV